MAEPSYNELKQQLAQAEKLIGQLKQDQGGLRQRKPGAGPRRSGGDDTVDGGVEVSWVPAASGGDEAAQAKGKGRRKGVETFGAGMERGREEDEGRDLSESEKKGRTHRRKGVRSGSKSAFRRMQ